MYENAFFKRNPQTFLPPKIVRAYLFTEIKDIFVLKNLNCDQQLQ